MTPMVQNTAWRHRFRWWRRDWGWTVLGWVCVGMAISWGTLLAERQDPVAGVFLLVVAAWAGILEREAMKRAERRLRERDREARQRVWKIMEENAARERLY